MTSNPAPGSDMQPCRSGPTGFAGVPMVTLPLPANAARQQGPAREFLAWADSHRRDRIRHAAGLAQITRHHDLNPSGDAMHQLRAWAERRAHEKLLHDSAIAQMRPH
ncbi:MAG: hypothetical protein VKI63_05810 [Cyanobium sp.]|nr:hypothetical protein [Cyanobium sp.]